MEAEIDANNYKSVDINSIALDRNRLGTLVFDRASEYLKRLQELFVEIDDLDYRSLLTPNEASDIDNRRKTFIEYLNRIRNFDINQPNPGEIRNQLEQEAENFFNDVASQLRPYLTYLRQEVEKKSQDRRVLQKEAKQAQQARKQYEDISKELSSQIKKLEKQQTQVEKGSGKLASKVLANYFDQEAEHFKEESQKWIRIRNIFFYLTLCILVFNIALYAVLATGFLFFNKVTIDDFFNVQYLVLKIALLALLSYGLAFASRNYRINSNLSVVNRHRRNVAQTIDDFLGTNPRQEIQDQIIKEGVIAMFQHIQSGYLSHRENSGDGSPATEIITNIFKNISSENK